MIAWLEICVACIPMSMRITPITRPTRLLPEKPKTTKETITTKILLLSAGNYFPYHSTFPLSKPQVHQMRRLAQKHRLPHCQHGTGVVVIKIQGWSRNRQKPQNIRLHE